MTTSPTRSGARSVLLGASSNVVCVLPMFLVGAVTVTMQRELRFGTIGLGAAVSAYWLANGATSVYLGRIVDRLGATRSIALAATVAAASAVGVAVAARWWHMAACLMATGCAHALGQPAANRMLMQVAPPGRRGTAFGMTYAAPPTAAMLAGFSVPTLDAAFGWRATFAASALAALALAIVAKRRAASLARPTLRRDPVPLERRAEAVAWAAAFGTVTAASTAVPAFYVDAAVDGGVSTPARAGLVLALASLAALATRVLSGRACDRMAAGHLQMCAALLGTGAAGLVLLAVGTRATTEAGVVVAMIGVWGFNAAFWFALVSRWAASPGRITGAIQPGPAFGAVVGPLLFGVLADRWSYSAAWAVCSVIAAAAAAAVLAGARRFAG